MTRRQALIVMELLEPHIIMRRGMIAGTVYPKFADDISTFMARTLYFTSDLALTADRKKAMIAAFAGNTALCKITEDLIFTDPYRVAELNRWTSPQLDSYAARWREDGDLKVAVSRLKLKFLSSAEAMLHGDLHTGSVMLTPEETRIIDPEFAFIGPMGFDVGAVIANFLLNYFSQDGHEKTPGEREAYRDWVLSTLEQIWTSFREKFLALWRENPTGDAYPPSLFQGAEGETRLAAERQAYMDRLWADTVGFAAAKMIRRILGLAHNIDLEWIEDKDTRATCEARALTLARDMMVNSGPLSLDPRRHRGRPPRPAGDEELLSRALREGRGNRLPVGGDHAALGDEARHIARGRHVEGEVRDLGASRARSPPSRSARPRCGPSCARPHARRAARWGFPSRRPPR